MRHLLLIAAALVLGACAPDDQVFDVSALSKRHQRIFAEATADLNERYPDRAQFEIGDGISAALYGAPCDDWWPNCGSAQHHPPFTDNTMSRGHRLIFRPESPVFTFRQEATHELCHVLGFDHDEGNPQGGSC